MTPRAVRFRITVTAVVLLTAFAGLALRAVQLAVVEGEQLRRRAERQQQAPVSLRPKRGRIVDRSGEPLALTRESAAVYVRPAEFAAGPQAVSAIAGILDLPAGLIAVKAASTSPFVYIDRRVPLNRWSAVEELGLPGIGSELTQVRYYPNGRLAGHVLGFVDIDGKGREGIERQLDADLRGEVETLDVGRDARGRRLLGDGRWRPLPRVGARVELTIDAGLQRTVENELEAAVREFAADGGTAVVMAPDTGEVLAMTSAPRFDPNRAGDSPADARRNRAITDYYEPGSTFKAILAAAALEHGVVRPGETIFCENGRYAIGRRVIHDAHPHGALTVAEVIQQSSNIGSAKVAERLGAARFAETIAAFGFGQPTGIDLPGEAVGQVRPVARWGRIHLATNAFGQGIAVTPLQLTRAFAAIANGGLLLRPFVVRRVVAEDGRVLYTGRPHVERRVMSPQIAAILTDILRGAVESGTGKAARIDGVAVAGKTGTAQKVVDGRYAARARMSSFVGYVPADAPQLVIMVVLDSPKKATYGGVVAAPAFRRIAEYGLDRLGVRAEMAVLPARQLVAAGPARFGQLRVVAGPVPVVDDSVPSVDVAFDRGGVPDFLGLGMRDALIQGRQLGWELRIDGSGYVVAQDPPPGALLAAGEIALKFGSNVP